MRLATALLPVFLLLSPSAVVADSIPLEPHFRKARQEATLEAVELAAANYRTALASGSHRALIDVVTADAAVEGRFEVIVAADEVGRGKPAPDVYLEAARRLGVAPADFQGARPLSGGVDLFVPLVQSPYSLGPDSPTTDRDARWLRLVGRVRPGATLEETNASLQAVLAALEAEYPQTNENRSALVRSFGRFPAQNRNGDMAAVVAGIDPLLREIVWDVPVAGPTLEGTPGSC